MKAVLFLILLLVSFPVFPQCTWSPRASSAFRTTALDLSVDGPHLWLATGYGIQLADRSTMRATDLLALPGTTRAVRADGRGYAYAGSGSRLYVLQRNGATVSVIGNVDTGATIHEILFVAPSYLFVATSNGLMHFDTIQPATPFRLGTVLPTSGANVTSLSTSGSKLYAADGDATIEVFSIGTPSLPQRTGELESMPRATAVHAQGDLVVVSDVFGQNTDIFAGTTRVGRLPIGANAFAAGTNGVHFAAGPDRTIRAVDFTSGSTLRELFEHQLPPTGGTDNVIHAIARAEDKLYVAAGDIGLAVFDVSPLHPPYPLASYRNTATTSVAMSAAADRAWFADASGTITERAITASGIALTTERTWSGGSIVHDVEGSTLLTSSNDTATLWSLTGTPAAAATTKFRAAVTHAAIRGGDVVAVLADGSAWLGGATPQQIALPPIAHLVRSGNGYLFTELRNEGRTVLHHYASGDFAGTPYRITLDGIAIGGAALNGSSAAVFTFSGVNVIDLSSAAVRTIPDSNRVIPRQLVFAGDDLLLLDKRELYVYDDARTLVREHLLPADAVMVDAHSSIAVMATGEGTMAALYLAEQPSASLASASSFQTKIAAGGERVYLLGPDGIEIRTPSLSHVLTVHAGGIVDLAAGPSGFFTLSAGGVVTAYTRYGVAYAQVTLNEGSDAQPLAIDTAGSAVWVSVSRGCLTGGCQKKTLILDPGSLATMTTLSGGVTDVVTNGSRAYALFDLPSEIRVLDITDPLHPSQLIAATAPATATSIAAHSGRVLVIGDRLYEYSEATLLLRGTHLTALTPDKAQQIRADGNCLLITARSASPQAYAAGTLVETAGAFEVPSPVRSIAVDAGRAFLLTTHSVELWSPTAVPRTKRRAVD